MLAVKGKHIKCVRLLLDYGSDPTVKTLEGQTARDLALQSRQETVWGADTPDGGDILRIIDQHKMGGLFLL